MIDINLIRSNPDQVKKAISNKGVDGELVDKLLDIDKKWRDLVAQTDALRAEKKTSGAKDIDRSKSIKNKLKTLEDELRIVDGERDVIAEQIPNIPFSDVPVGKYDVDNVVLREVGEKLKFDFEPKDYLTLANNLINIEKASAVAGSRFGYIFGDLVLLEFALVKLAFDKLLPQGFMPVVPPVMVKPAILKGMGKIKFIEGDDAFYLPKDDLYLVGSSEHTIGPIHMDSLIQGDLPKRYLGFSTCFRREAGSYGKDTKGILRVHQFDKVEMFSFTKPEDSKTEHEFFLKWQEELMQALKMPYRVMSICTGDMGFGDAKQYDIETWLPGQGKYRETQSCSNTTDYQSRGLNIKYRSGHDKRDFVHTLNGTAFAIGRMIIAILENYQKKDGSIDVPEALRNYVGKKEIKPL